MSPQMLLAKDWSRLVSKHFVNLEITNSSSVSGSFTGHIRGTIRISQLQASGHFGHRTKAAADSESAGIVVALATHGNVIVEQQDRSVSLQAGDVALYTTADEFRVGSLSNFGVRLAVVPYDRISVDAECVLRNTARPLSSVLTARLRESFIALNRGVEVDASEDRLVRLLATLPSFRGTNRRVDLSGRDVRQEALQFIDENLTSHEVSANTVAHALGISLRTLYKHFDPEAKTIAEFLRQRRLRFAFELISSGEADLISDAALAAGFQNLSHFSRLFKKEFGISPSVLHRRNS